MKPPRSPLTGRVGIDTDIQVGRDAAVQAHAQQAQVRVIGHAHLFVAERDCAVSRGQVIGGQGRARQTQQEGQAMVAHGLGRAGKGRTNSSRSPAPPFTVHRKLTVGPASAGRCRPAHMLPRPPWRAEGPPPQSGRLAWRLAEHQPSHVAEVADEAHVEPGLDERGQTLEVRLVRRRQDEFADADALGGDDLLADAGRPAGPGQ